MPLTDAHVRLAKPGAKPYKLSDEKGLYLLITPSGGKLWRMKYRFGGKEKTLALGAYPDVSLKDARDRRDEARKLLANGQDPGAVKQAQKAAKLKKAANSFEVVARECLGVWKVGKAESHSSKVIARMENDVFPWIGNMPVSEVKPPVILEVLNRITGRGTIETAHRTKSNISRVMRYAVSKGFIERDPCPDLRDALPSPTKRHMAAIIDSIKAGELLRAIYDYRDTFVVKAALKLLPLVFVRPGELRMAKWSDFDLDEGTWEFTPTKTKNPLIVPLATQAVAILRELQQLTGNGELVFPGVRYGRPLSNMTFNRSLQAMGYDTQKEHTGHGFRAMAQTLLQERLGAEKERVEQQLNHKKRGLGTAYDHSEYLKERRAMMQVWADYLDGLRTGAEVVPLRA